MMNNVHAVDAPHRSTPPPSVDLADITAAPAVIATVPPHPQNSAQQLRLSPQHYPQQPQQQQQPAAQQRMSPALSAASTGAGQPPAPLHLDPALGPSGIVPMVDPADASLTEPLQQHRVNVNAAPFHPGQANVSKQPTALQQFHQHMGGSSTTTQGASYPQSPQVLPSKPMMASDSASEFNASTGMYERVHRSTVLRMRGLPFSATPQDVITFFQGYNLDPKEDSVLVISQGSHRGEGFVRFVSDVECARAQHFRHRATMGPRYIELYQTTVATMDQHREHQLQIQSECAYLVRLRGLPFTATEENIMAFMEPVQQHVRAIRMCTGPDARFTGNAFVEFDTHDAVVMAKARLDRQMMGTRYIEVFESSPFERETQFALDRRNGRVAHNKKRDGPGQAAALGPAANGGSVPTVSIGYKPHTSPNGPASQSAFAALQSPNIGLPQFPSQLQTATQPSVTVGGARQDFAVNNANPASGAPLLQSTELPVVRVRGFSPQANETTVAEFLNGVRIAVAGLHLVYSTHGQRTGEAFVEVLSEDDVRTALLRGMHRTDGLEVYVSSQAEMRTFQAGLPSPATSSPTQQQTEQQLALAAQLAMLAQQNHTPPTQQDGAVRNNPLCVGDGQQSGAGSPRFPHVQAAVQALTAQGAPQPTALQNAFSMMPPSMSLSASVATNSMAGMMQHSGVYNAMTPFTQGSVSQNVPLSPALADQ